MRIDAVKLANRMKSISPNILADLEDKKRERLLQNKPVYNLSAGTPDLPPDEHVMKALSEACLVPENYKYAITDLPELLDAAIGWYDRRFNVSLERDNITAVYGTQEGMAHICFPLCDPGDIVLVPDPGYPVFRFGPFMMGAEVVPIPLSASNGFLIDFEKIDSELAKKAKVMIVCYPNNPVTAYATDDFYLNLIAFAKKYDIFVIHDNAYGELMLDGKIGRSFLSFPGAMEVGMEFNSLSKSYNLPGMRISFAIGDKDVIKAFKSMRSQIDYAHFQAIQKAAIAVLNGPQDILERNRNEYKARRDALAEGLNKIGWEVPRNNGTMFVWYPIPKGYTDDFEFAMELIEKTGIICVPGQSFGEMGKGYIRIALVEPIPVLEEAVSALAASGMISK